MPKYRWIHVHITPRGTTTLSETIASGVFFVKNDEQAKRLANEKSKANRWYKRWHLESDGTYCKHRPDALNKNPLFPINIEYIRLWRDEKRKIRSTKMNRSHVSRQPLPETEPDPTTEGDEYLDKVSSFRFTEYFTVPIGRVRDSTEVFTRTIGEEYTITTTHRFAEKILAALEGIGVWDMEEIDE